MTRSAVLANPRLLVERTAARLGRAAVAILWRSESGRNRLQRFLQKWWVQQPDVLRRFWYAVVFDYWIDRVYLREADPDRREALKDLCMGGEPGVQWAEIYDARPVCRSDRVGDLSFDDAMPVYPAMDRLLAAATPGTVVVQVGSSSGREMAYFAERFPHVDFIGLDIDEGIAERATSRHGRHNLRFAVGRAHTLLTDAHVPAGQPLIIFSNGSLQYVQPEHMAVAMRRWAARGNVVVTLVESARDDGTSPDALAGSRWRGNFTYTHDYRWYGEQAGLETVEHAVIQTDGDRRSPHYRTRHYFYVGRSS